MKKVEVWERTDIILKSEKSYKNPYLDVDIDATFTHEDGTEIKLYGFWNGGDEWRVRFSPTKKGVWTYVITCTDGTNASLHNVKGSLLAVRNTGNTELSKHGFIRVSDNGRYFVYDDGTPFYWLGDTNWQAPNYVSITKCNYPGCDCGNQFVHEVNDRVNKGFTVYQTYFDGGETDGGGQRSVTKEPSMWVSKYKKINPDAFNNKYDFMFDYLAARGMVTALGFGVHNSTASAMKQEELDRLSRYLTARYASYPVVWITAQEITGEEQFDKWVSSARVVDAGDGYNHPQSAHQYPLSADNRFVEKLNKESWHDFYALQNGHGPTMPKKSTYQGYYRSKAPDGGAKPFIETESNYEDIYCGGFNGYNASRLSAWKANLCGSYGFTYGVTGIWANCYSTSGSTGWLGTYSTEPWYMGLDKPGSYEMKYMADFFRYVDFSTLIPRFSGSAYSDLKDETKVVASSEDCKTYVAYFYNSDRSTGTLNKLNEGEKYSAKWYDVLTGKFITISDDIEHSGGKYKIPEKPDTSDWVLLVTSRTDLGDFETEAPREFKAKHSGNILTGSTARASSHSSGSNSGNAIDGSSDTWWCASDGSFPQWLMFDMKEAKEFDSYSLKMYPGTSALSYKCEVSDDGENWKTVHTGKKEGPRNAGEYLFEIKLDKVYSSRYIRFSFDEAYGNWAAVVEAQAWLSEKTELVKIDGDVQTPGVTCVGGCTYTAAGKPSDTSANLTDGDLSTEWKPFASESTQTVIMDMYESKDVYGIEVYLGKNSEVPDYRIEGSNDRDSWSVLYDSSVSGICSGTVDGRNVISNAFSGKYRYIKLIIMGGSGKNAKKTIAEIKLYANGKTGEAPAAADLSGLKSLYTEYKNIRNGKGEYPAGSYRNFLIALGGAAEAAARAAVITDAEVKSAENALKSAQANLTVHPDYTEPDPPETTEETDKTTDTETETSEITTNNTETNDVSGKENEKSFPVFPVIAGAAAVIAAVTAVIVIINRKNKGKSKQ